MATDIKRATGLLVIEAVNSNPNGDPDRESSPRQRPNGQGEISPVSFKRKLRDLLENESGVLWEALPEKFNSRRDSYAILESRGRTDEEITKEIKNGSFTGKYWDARLFGNTFLETTKTIGKEFIKTGVVQFGVGVSVSPVTIVYHTNTKKRGMGSKSAGMAPLAFRIVEHGVYCMPFFVNPNFADKSGCTANDVELLKLLIPHAYDLNRSAIRPDVRLRHAWYMEHKNSLGSCPEYLLIDALTPVRKSDAAKASADWSDYEDKTSLSGDLASKLASVADLMAS
ncbi:MAG: type I CRISPR-associated protein Cas7 [Desulfovibrio sp.]|nr:type I CRISPR-associated protein Cas7 [Desulfovibrio sp.]